MIWNKTLETGIESIDKQHQELFRRANVLLDNKQENRIEETLDFLSSYVVTHFREEELMHRKTGYPEAAAHKKLHDDYIKAFGELRERYKQEGQTLTTTLAIYNNVTEWLSKHIMGADMAFAKFNKTK